MEAVRRRIGRAGRLVLGDIGLQGALFDELGIAATVDFAATQLRLVSNMS
jgi:hypothetical protein